MAHIATQFRPSRAAGRAPLIALLTTFALIVSVLLAPDRAEAADNITTWRYGDECPDVLVHGFRGSGQERDSSGNFTRNTPTLGLGAEVHLFAASLTDRLQQEGKDVAVYADPYPAIPVSHFNADDIDIWKSLDTAKLNAGIMTAYVASMCPADTKLVLAGYSQGAWAAREGLSFTRTEDQDRVGAVALIADPQFDPDGGGRLFGSFDPDQGGLLGRASPPTWIRDSTVHVCMALDIVCQSENPDNIFSNYAYSQLRSSVHTESYKRQEVGSITANTVANLLLGTTPPGSGDSDTSGGVAVALIIDSSGSMSSSDPQDRRIDAGRAFITASTVDDQVGVVDFDSTARVLSDPRSPVQGRSALLAALSQIDSSGGTNLGAGLTAGCEMLGRADSALAKGAIFLTDGSGSYNNQASCFAEKGWKVFTMGLGNGVNQELLQGIADQTGGNYSQLSSSLDLVCEFQQIRAVMAGSIAQDCAPTGSIRQGETLSFAKALTTALRQVTFTVTWPGSDVQMTVVSPSGRRIGREEAGSDVVVDTGETYQTTTVQHPEPGEWTVELYGAEIPEESEPYSFNTVELAEEEGPPTAVLEAQPSEGLEWNFDGSGSFDTNGGVLAHLWSFGDGTVGSGERATHVYRWPGRYVAHLTAVDEQLRSTTVTKTIDVGGASAPPPMCEGQVATIVAGSKGMTFGGPGDDVIVGTPAADQIDGRAGADLICGSGGSDKLRGGDGDALISGGEGDDTLWGDNGDDVLFGDDGDDRLMAGAGSDTLYGGPGEDRLDGKRGVDTCIANEGDAVKNCP